MKKRCSWATKELDIAYHDTEWGVPLHDDDQLFELLMLEGFQAGLSWSTILAKRENFRKAFDNFDALKISRYTEKKAQQLLNDAGIVRNRLKVYGTIKNAKAYLAIKKEFKSFDTYIWQFTNYKTIDHKLASFRDIVATTPESDAMSKDLKKRGFTFVGSTICYAFMQASGMVNDHLTACFRYKECKKLAK